MGYYVAEQDLEYVTTTGIHRSYKKGDAIDVTAVGFNPKLWAEKGVLSYYQEPRPDTVVKPPPRAGKSAAVKAAAAPKGKRSKEKKAVSKPKPASPGQEG